MTNNNHPITPPPELQEQWKQEWLSVRLSFTNFHQWMLAKSAQWGADQELEACCEWFAKRYGKHLDVMGLLRNARRSKPPSLNKRDHQRACDLAEAIAQEVDTRDYASLSAAAAIPHLEAALAALDQNEPSH